MWFGIQQKTFQRNAQQNIQTVTVEGMIGKYLSLISITRQRDPLNTIKHQHLLKIFFLFETVLYNSSQATLCQWVFKMLLHSL